MSSTACGDAPRARAHERLRVLAPVAAMLLLLAGCGKGKSESGKPDAAADSTGAAPAVAAEGESAADDAAKSDAATEDGDKTERQERAVSVTATAVVLGDLVVPVVAEGTVRARRQTEIRFELTGRIGAVSVAEGQRVRRGHVLATLDDREHRVALEEARANFLQALGQIAVEEDSPSTGTQLKQELDQALTDLDQQEEDGKLSRQERREREIQLGVDAVKQGAYRRELLEVRSGLATARASEARAELNLERTVIRAPFDGVVSELLLHPGQRVQVGDRLCTVVDDVDLEAEIGVLESDLRGLEVGREALLTVPALDATLPAKVDVISPSIDPQSRTCRVLLRLRNTGGRVKPGMFVRAAIAGQMLQGRVLVPRAAILTRDGRPLLFKVEDDRARWVYVQLGQRNDAAVEIERVLQGGPLDPGTLVIVDNHLTLTHDAKVKVSKTVPLDDPWAQRASATP